MMGFTIFDGAASGSDTRQSVVVRVSQLASGCSVDVAFCRLKAATESSCQHVTKPLNLLEPESAAVSLIQCTPSPEYQITARYRVSIIIKLRVEFSCGYRPTPCRHRRILIQLQIHQ
jgi:hypothetical protein